MPITLDVTQGLDRTFLLRVADAAGNPFAPGTNPSPFDGTEALAARVWQGDDLPVLCAPACAWYDPLTAAYTLTVTAAQSAALAVGAYRCQATASKGGRTGGILGTRAPARLRVLAAPGTGTAGPSFCSLADVLAYCPWAEDLQDDREQFAFQRERARATSDLIDALVNQWDTRTLSPQIGQPGFNAIVSGWGSLAASPSKWLYDQLVPLAPGSAVPATFPNRASTPANLYDPAVSTALLLKQHVKELVAKRALESVFRAQVGRDDSRPWRALAAHWRREADALFRSTRFEVDLAVPQTGWASITIAGGWGSLR